MAGNKTQLLLDGKADVTFAPGSQERACQRLGLHTRLLPRYPMVNSITLTSLVPLVQDNPELYIRMIKAIATGIAMVNRDKEKTLELLAGNVADRLGIRDDIELESFYQKLRASLEPRLYPKINSLYNAYRIAELVYPELKKRAIRSSSGIFTTYACSKRKAFSTSCTVNEMAIGQ